MKEKKIKLISSLIIVILILCVVIYFNSHRTLAYILHKPNLDNVARAECIWYPDNATEIYKANYADKLYAPYFGQIGSTANATITLYDENNNKINEFTDLGSFGLIEYNGHIFQERGCYADQGLKHVWHTISSGFLSMFIYYI